MKPVLFGFPRSVVKATMVIIYIYKGAHKLPSANYPPFSVTLFSQIRTAIYTHMEARCSTFPVFYSQLIFVCAEMVKDFRVRSTDQTLNEKKVRGRLFAWCGLGLH